jgi:MYXO-CTERM domain-containing protein
VEKLSPTGLDLGVFATVSNGPAAGLAVDHAGNLYVAVGGGLDGQPPAPNQVAVIEKFDSSGHDLGNVLAGITSQIYPFVRNVAVDDAGNVVFTTTDGLVNELPAGNTDGVVDSFGPSQNNDNNAAFGFLSNGDILVTTSNTVADASSNSGNLINALDPNSSFYNFEQDVIGGPPNWTGMAVQPTPEPASAVLGLIGGGLLLSRRRRRSGSV